MEKGGENSERYTSNICVFNYALILQHVETKFTLEKELIVLLESLL